MVLQSRFTLPRVQSSRRTGFTLVELLVVIGIIALLIALLLPTVTVARQQATRTACEAKLHNIMIAATLHAADHRGFYPLAGYLPGADPSDLGDDYTQNYDYFQYIDTSENFSSPHLLAPITMALARGMGYPHILDVTDDAQQSAEEQSDTGFIRNFICPSQVGSVSDLVQFYSVANSFPLLYIGQFPPNWIFQYSQAQSYIYNEGVLGYDDAFGRLRGQTSQIRQSGRTMFASDGLPGTAAPVRYSPDQIIYYPQVGTMTVYNNQRAPVTLGNALVGDGIAGDPNSFDTKRHQGRMNIAFCDGHVECLQITPKELSKVFILAP